MRISHFTVTFIALCLSFLTGPLRGQGSHPFRHLNVDNGLSSNYVVDIAQDYQGFIWIATESGLNKFDGTEVTVYNTQNSALSSNELNTVYCDPSTRTVYIGTQRHGLCVYDCVSQQFTACYNSQNGLLSSDVTDLSRAADGGIWVTHYHLGVEHFDPKNHTFTPWRMSDIAHFEGTSWCSRDDGNGHLYVGHDGQGMSLIDLKQRTCRSFTHQDDPHSLPGNIVHCIFIDRDHRVWVGTNNGLALFHPEQGTFTTFRHEEGNPHSLLSNYVYDIGQADDGRLWVCTQMGGVSILDPQALSSGDVRFDNIGAGQRDGISSANARCFFQDSFGNIWIGNYRQGIDFLSYERPIFRTLLPTGSSTDASGANQVWSLAVDNRSLLWAGCENRLVAFDGEREAFTLELTGLASPNTHVNALYKDRKGLLWLGLYNDGVLTCDPATRRLTRIASPNPALDVRDFHEDADGTIWVATLNGLYICRNGRLERRDDITRQLPDRMVNRILRDRKGNLWVGTFGKGIVAFNPAYKLICALDETNGLGSNAVNDCLVDRQGGIWIATRNGISCLPDPSRPKDCRLYSGKQGLVNVHVRALAEDRDGEIWLSTNGGISRWNRKEQQFENYTSDEGVPKGDFMDGAVCTDRNGQLCFGSQRGVCSFSPTDIDRPRRLSPVVITEVRSFSSTGDMKNLERILPLADGQTIRLAHDENTFHIAFNVMDYTRSRQVEYAYLMEGLHTAWFENGNDHRVMFRNLPPGTYTFRVKARLRNQPWSTDETSVSIRILPPLWLTGYAKLFYLAVGCLLLYLALRFYKHRLELENRLKLERHQHENDRKLNDERLRFYTNMTHELRTPLTLILGPLEDLLQDKTLSPGHANKLSAIRDSSVRLLNLINQLLEFRKTETENRRLCVERADLGKLVQEIGLRYKELNSNARVDFRLSIAPTDTTLYFDPDVMTIILDNLLSNAIKYTPQGSISLSIATETTDGTRHTVIRISDTGHGISAEALPHIFERYYQEDSPHRASGTGIGLALVKSLVSLHQGTIDAKSTPGEGSTFTVSLLTDNFYPDALHKESRTDAVPPEAASDEQPETTDDNRPIVLVVEDNADIREYIRSSLADRYNVVTAADGQEGLDAAQQQIPDLIVSDIMMPVMDGVTLCRLVKEDVQTSHIPVILLTAKDSTRDKEEGYAAGADSYLSKPFSAGLLISRIDNLLNNRRRLARLIGSQQTEEPGQEETDALRKLSKLDRNFLEKVNRVIEENMSLERMDIAFIADKMCMSHSTLYRKVKALMNISVNELVRDAKMRHAATLLESGEYTVTEVSDMTGFSSVPYFRQRFKEKYGMSPSEFMKKK